MSDPIRALDPRVQAPRGPALPVRPAGSRPAASGTAPFGEVLRETLASTGSEAVRFSAHALDRLHERNVHLTRYDLEQIQSAVDKAAAKGSRESLLLKSDLALVVNVPNRTVITALTGNGMREHVFTNIDSAVLLQ